MMCLLRGELALTHAWVACVSRLIGNSDTTGKVSLWQVQVLGGTAFGNKAGKLQECQSDHGECPPKKAPRRTKRHPSGVAFQYRRGALSWSLASQ